jgi:tetratricopeptide (TPR) repeat protein
MALVARWYGMGRSSVRPIPLAVAAFLAYAVLFGGTAHGEVSPLLRLGNVLVAGGLVAVFLLRAPARSDRVDAAVAIGLLLFVGAALFSQLPRQSFDAALTALTYAAGFFVARDVFMRRDAARAALATLMALSALLTIVAAARWLPIVLEWWALTGWNVTPPLDLSLPAAPWGHRHDLAMLLVLLYPSWWTGVLTPIRAAMATVIGALTAIVVLVDGSRSLWLGIAVGAAVVAIPMISRRVRWTRWYTIGALAAALGAVAVVAVTGWGGALLDRALTFSTLNTRSAMWQHLTDLWLRDPVAGVGPGSFPWTLQMTGFFDTNTWAPRHPDSLPFQLLPEAGLLGVAAVVLIAGVLLRSIVAASCTPATFAIVAFAVGGIGANPTDFGFLNVVAITWVALAVPHRLTNARRPGRWFRVAAFACLGVIGIATAATTVAGFAYSQARSLVHDGQLDRAGGWLSAAVTLDPSMALYARQRGTLRLMATELADARRDLSRATSLNPNDDLAWRARALAELAAGDRAAATASVNRAVELQRSDPTNLLLLEHLQAGVGDPTSDEVAAEIVQGWPSVVSAPEVNPLVQDRLDATAVDGAIARWEAGRGAPVPVRTQVLALMVLGDRPDLRAEAIDESRLSAELAELTLAVYSCDPRADRLLAAASDSSRRQAHYWALVMMHSARSGAVDADAARLRQLMTGGSLSSDDMDRALNPLWENNASGFSADAWGYRRAPIFWPPIEPMLPSPDAGAARWLLDTSPERPFAC